MLKGEKHGAWSMEHGAWSMEHGAWSGERRTDWTDLGGRESERGEAPAALWRPSGICCAFHGRTVVGGGEWGRRGAPRVTAATAHRPPVGPTGTSARLGSGGEAHCGWLEGCGERLPARRAIPSGPQAYWLEAARRGREQGKAPPSGGRAGFCLVRLCGPGF
jgi:hypothetical protein